MFGVCEEAVGVRVQARCNNKMGPWAATGTTTASRHDHSGRDGAASGEYVREEAAAGQAKVRKVCLVQ